jgi:hypothetical protein
MKRTVVLYLRVDEDVKDGLAEAAIRDDRSMSVMANLLLRKALKIPKDNSIIQ